ncbi:cytochrome c oxidase assembly protein [Streptomyces sp. cg36]|uniref:cytochrome c oxidase assembly protein n=1 Tax=Streptomyces sp. cg36 TaxID=3238798 RepID=UPI0034E1AC92
MIAATVAVAVLLGVPYLVAAARLRGRGDPWPRRRDAAFTAGAVVLVASVAGTAAHDATVTGRPFTHHMAGHLGTAMAAPLLFAAGRPVTLALRALPPGPPRRTLVALARSRPVALLLHPPVAAVLDVGGLWLLYRTPLLARTHHTPSLDAVVHLHLLLAGCLFTFAVLAREPVRHRPATLTRALILLAASAAHAVLAKSLYAHGPPGTAYTAADLHAAAQLMYYGGDAVELALALLIGHQWYRAEGRRRTPGRRLGAAGPVIRAR